MTEVSDRPRVLKAIKKCISDAHEHFQEAMDVLDELGRASLGAGMTPFFGGYLMKDPKDNYRTARIEVESAKKALYPLTKRFRDGRVNAEHFTDEEALTHLKDLTEFDYQLLIKLLLECKGRESVWYRLEELSNKAKAVFEKVADT
ncbi:MAG: hypothetical protein KAT22_03160 [Candidatus Thorarchaeota archaeon]|nr:hypothetical protein [Candidatus Thorarchaeota archaeon]